MAAPGREKCPCGWEGASLHLHLASKKAQKQGCVEKVLAAQRDATRLQQQVLPPPPPPGAGAAAAAGRRKRQRAPTGAEGGLVEQRSEGEGTERPAKQWRRGSGDTGGGGSRGFAPASSAAPRTQQQQQLAKEGEEADMGGQKEAERPAKRRRWRSSDSGGDGSLGPASTSQQQQQLAEEGEEADMGGWPALSQAAASQAHSVRGAGAVAGGPPPINLSAAVRSSGLLRPRGGGGSGSGGDGGGGGRGDVTQRRLAAEPLPLTAVEKHALSTTPDLTKKKADANLKCALLSGPGCCSGCSVWVWLCTPPHSAPCAMPAPAGRGCLPASPAPLAPRSGSSIAATLGRCASKTWPASSRFWRT